MCHTHMGDMGGHSLHHPPALHACWPTHNGQAGGWAGAEQVGCVALSSLCKGSARSTQQPRHPPFTKAGARGMFPCSSSPCNSRMFPCRAALAAALSQAPRRWGPEGGGGVLLTSLPYVCSGGFVPSPLSPGGGGVVAPQGRYACPQQRPHPQRWGVRRVRLAGVALTQHRQLLCYPSATRGISTCIAC